MTPAFRGYVDAGALELYCERHGAGQPLVLVHGSFGTKAQLAVLPGTSHEDILDRVEWLSSMITAFLLPQPQS